MSRVHPHDQSLRVLSARAKAVPIVSTLAGSLLALMPIVATVPLLPPFGLLTLLAWKLLRPELWPVWIGLPLGLFDDLVSGEPIGTAMALWTLALLMIDAVEQRLLWRDYWQEWLMAGIAIVLVIGGGWLAAQWMGAPLRFRVLLPQLVTAVLCFPVVGRLCAILDRWRLAR